MIKINVDENMLNKLKEMLKKEGEGYFIRLREYKLGAACRTRIILGIAVDDELNEEDRKVEIGDIPFVIEDDLIERYGKEYEIKQNNEGQIEVIGLEE